MNKIDAAQLTRKALDQELGELGAQCMDQVLSAVRADAERGFAECDVRILAHPTLSADAAVRIGTKVAARIELGGFRCRFRLSDDFLRDGPNILAPGLQFERGSTMLWLEFDVSWD